MKHSQKIRVKFTALGLKLLKLTPHVLFVLEALKRVNFTLILFYHSIHQTHGKIQHSPLDNMLSSFEIQLKSEIF